MNRPPQPPYGALIEEARKHRAGLSMREAARRAGISDAWWRYVVNGWQNGPITGPADTVAAMARVAQVTPDEMESRGERADVAVLLRAEPQPAAVPQPAPAPVAFPGASMPGDDARDRFMDWFAAQLMEAEPGDLPALREFADLAASADPRDLDTLRAIGRTRDAEGRPYPWRRRHEIAFEYLNMFDAAQRRDEAGTALATLLSLATFRRKCRHLSLCDCTRA